PERSRWGATPRQSPETREVLLWPYGSCAGGIGRAGACTWAGENQGGESLFQVQRRDQREQPPRRVEIDLDLAFEPLAQQMRAVVMQPAPAHVDRLDAGRQRGPERRVIAVADLVIVLEHAAERGERQEHAPVFVAAGQSDVEQQPGFRRGKDQMIWTSWRASGAEVVFLQKVVD